MHLALNTMVYEAGNVNLKDSLKKAKKFGFKYIDINAWKTGDPTEINNKDKNEIKEILNDLGLISSQLLMINTYNLASSDKKKREHVLDYMKKCADFQLELGGKQVLVCWGGGVYELETSKTKSWINSVEIMKKYTEWSLDKGILIELELDPHVYFLINSLNKMLAYIEDVNMPNLFANIDIGHLYITRENAISLDKIQDKILHVHISETDTFEHTNSIIGTGKIDVQKYYTKLKKLNFDKNCKNYGEIPVIDIEMGEPGRFVDEPDRWVRESLEYLNNIIPDLSF